MEKVADLLTGLAMQFAEVTKLIKDLQLPDLKIVEISRKELFKRLPILGELINQIILKYRTAEFHSELILIADDLDNSGFHVHANTVDSIIKSGMSYKDSLNELRRIYYDLSGGCAKCVEKVMSKYSSETQEDNLIKLADYFDKNGDFNSANIIDKAANLLCSSKEKKEEPIIQQPYKGSLSTRYCPDHVGTPTVRIAEYIYQCPLDGKVYDYMSGYTNYKGEKVLGGSVAEQTPSTSDFGGIPMRIYDGRQNILNTIN